MTNSSCSMALLRSFSTSNRVNARSYIAELNTLKSPPSSLTRYMAVSASLRRPSASWVRAPPKEMPMLAITYSSRPSMINGLRSSSVILSATCTACAGSSTASISMTNSSPPKRARVSSGRKQRLRRWATSVRRRSPTSCPRESFTTVKPSRSMNSTAIRLCRLLVRLKACPRRSMKSWRLGEVSETIVECLVMQALFQSLTLGKIVEDPLPVEGFARFVPYQHRLLTHPHHRAVLGHQTVLFAEWLLAPRLEALIGGKDPLTVAWVETLGPQLLGLPLLGVYPSICSICGLV